jgi:hypothetical protein
MDFTKLNQHTRLWRWIVYSRATTSAMAERPVLPAAFFAVGAISAEVVLADVLVNNCVLIIVANRELHCGDYRKLGSRGQVFDGLYVLTEVLAAGLVDG